MRRYPTSVLEEGLQPTGFPRAHSRPRLHQLRSRDALPDGARTPNAAQRPLAGNPAGGTFSSAADRRVRHFARERYTARARVQPRAAAGRVSFSGGHKRYGYGFVEYREDFVEQVGNDGGLPGASAFFPWLPELGDAVVVLSNYDGPMPAPEVGRRIVWRLGRSRSPRSPSRDEHFPSHRLLVGAAPNRSWLDLEPRTIRVNDEKCGPCYDVLAQRKCSKCPPLARPSSIKLRPAARALPLFLILTGIGGCLGLATRRHTAGSARAGGISMMLALPYLLAPVEHRITTPTELRQVENTVVIHAPTSTVWREVKSVPRIDARELPLRFAHLIGLPRPLSATLSQDGVGGVRNASFERGLVFRETVTDWQPERRLAFSITAEPRREPHSTSTSPWVAPTSTCSTAAIGSNRSQMGRRGSDSRATSGSPRISTFTRGSGPTSSCPTCSRRSWKWFESAAKARTDSDQRNPKRQ